MSAQDVVEDLNLAIDPITRSKSYSEEEVRHFQIGVDDMDSIALKIWSPNAPTKKKTVTRELRPAITDAIIEDAIDATPSFTITVHDPDWDLLNSGSLDHTIDINPGHIPHIWYRLNAIEVQDAEITLTFLTRNAMYLSYHTRPYKVSRNRMTRAEFILTLLHHVKKKGVNIKMFCKQLHDKQPIAKTKPVSNKHTNRTRAGGLDPDAKLDVTSNAGKRSVADSGQLKVLEEVLQAGTSVGAPPAALLLALMVVQIETDTGHSRNANPKYHGVFQQDPRYWPATGDVTKDALGARGKHGFFDVAIPAVRNNKNMDLGQLGASGAVQGAGDVEYAMKLNRARPTAEKILEAFDPSLKGSDIGGNTSFAARYEFMVGPPDGPRGENYLAAMYRLAEEVNWRAYWVRDVLHYISEEDLFKSKARARLRYHLIGTEGRTPGGQVSSPVESVQASWDRGKEVNQISLSVRMERWVAPVGTVVIFDEGGPMQGRWLVTNIRRSVFDPLGEITLMQPMTEKHEPAHSMKNRPVDGGDTKPVTTGDIEGTPKDIIDNVVLPIADSIGIHKTVAQNDIDNHNHTHLGSASDHAGPSNVKWAADISDGTMTPKEKELAKALADHFDIPWSFPILASSYSKDGQYRFQVIHGANFPEPTGDHTDHVHFGVKRLKPAPAARTQQSPHDTGPGR